MFSIRRPSPEQIEEFINQSKALTLSYDQVGIANGKPSGFKADEASAVIGTGRDVFVRARDALTNWQQFKLVGLSYFRVALQSSRTPTSRFWLVIWDAGRSMDVGSFIQSMVRCDLVLRMER